MPLLITNANILTMNAAAPRAEAAVVEGTRFSFVGSEQGARAYLQFQPHTVLDAEGCTVVPGFNDSHMHAVHTALRARSVSLEGAKSVAEAVERLRAGLSQLHRDFLIGEGWNQENFLEKRMLTRADLDAVSTDVPILASRACGHILAANSRALAMAGVEAGDGILREDEQGAVLRLVPPTDDRDALEALFALEPRLFKQGITSIQSDDLHSVPEHRAELFIRALRDAGDLGKLKVRYALQANLGSLPALRTFFFDGLHLLRGDRFRVACVKLLADGSLGARTAWLAKPYADAPDTAGIPLYRTDELCALVRESASHGMPAAIHAIGDAAMQQVLDAFEREGRGLRNAVVHAQITTADQIRRCGRLGLCILAQPIFLKADVPIVARRVGGALSATSYRWRSMLCGGARVAFGTDCPVEPFDVFENLYRAVSRRAGPGDAPFLPDEAFTLDEAIYAYTAAGAYASGEENVKGLIWPEMLADFVVLDRRLPENEPEALLETQVRATYIGGDLVYERA